jgi:transcriptional regulator with XRE-family HTH domain
MSLSTNIKFLRKADGNLSQTEWGKKFNLTRGMVDSYEREVAKPDNITLQSIASHYKLSIEILVNKSLPENPGLLYAGEILNSNQQGTGQQKDILKAKDELIASLQNTIKFQQKQIEQLTAALASHR